MLPSMYLFAHSVLQDKDSAPKGGAIRRQRAMRTATARKETPPSEAAEKFLYVYSCDLHDFVEVKVSVLEGTFRDAFDPTRPPGPMIIEATIYTEGRAAGATVSTSYAALSPSMKNHIVAWNEWLRLPVRYSELSRDAFVHLTMWDQLEALGAPPVESAERRRAADSSCVRVEDLDDEWDEWLSPASTTMACSSSSVYPRRLMAECSLRLFTDRGVLRTGTLDLQMEVVCRPNPRREPCEPWTFANAYGDTDKLIREYENRRAELERKADWLSLFTVASIENIKREALRAQRSLFLVVQLASVERDRARYDVVHYERDVSVAPRKFVGGEGDNELGMDNPCEAKHAFMTRNARSGAAQRRLKPNTQARKKIEAILELPPSQPLTAEQKNMIWRFRYFLSNNNRALTKFLHAVNWEQENEVEQALQLLEEWKKPIRPEDALELLSPSFTHPRVRAYAVQRLLLSAAPDILQLFLPQLVQALKYEPHHLTVDLNVAAVETTISEDAPDIVQVNESESTTDDLASFLVQYSTSYLSFANSLFWHLKVEEQATAGSEHAHMYSSLRKQLIAALEAASNADVRQRATVLVEQEKFVNLLKEITKEAKAKGTSREKRDAALKDLLSKNAKLHNLDGLPLPIDPNFRMQSVVPERATFFNSAMAPSRLAFRGRRSGATVHEPVNDMYTLIFKQGDDLRQDQLVMQMIRLMDGLLKDSQLDLGLTPYAVMATGVDEGFVQFIKAMPVRDVVQKHGSIQEAMKSFRPSPRDQYGIEPDVIDNYVRSLAGYSIICYILGVGDRHLDNLLLCENGKLFHVDFGYILGRDPKPMPPPMKLTTEMIQAMGGIGSEHWKRFVSLCDTAFHILRRHANLILNLFALMLDAGIPDIAIEKDKAVSKVEQRLQLQLTDDQRFAFVNRLIDTSVAAKMPVLVDFMHDLRQNFF